MQQGDPPLINVVTAGASRSRRGAPGMKGRLARRRVSPEGEDESPLPAITLAAGLGSLTLLPALSFAALLLAPVAVVLGWVNRRRCRREGRDVDWMGSVGWGIGVFVTAPIALAILVWLIPRMLTATRAPLPPPTGW